jgi:hypothetical protein
MLSIRRVKLITVNNMVPIVYFFYVTVTLLLSYMHAIV